VTVRMVLTGSRFLNPLGCDSAELAATLTISAMSGPARGGCSVTSS